LVTEYHYTSVAIAALPSPGIVEIKGATTTTATICGSSTAI